MKKIILLLLLVCSLSVQARGKFDNTDTITVAKDGSGQFTRINDAIEVCRAFMEYKKVIFVKNGIYKEKVVVPSWLTNIEIVGEDRDKTVITSDDYANITSPVTGLPMGTLPHIHCKSGGNGHHIPKYYDREQRTETRTGCGSAYRG